MLLGTKVKRVFVTGGAGFIGSHVVDLLMRQGYETRAYDNLSNGHQEFIQQHIGRPGFDFVKADLGDMDRLAEAMAGYDLVWHLAANTDIIGGAEQPRRDLRDCVIGTFNVLEAMRANGIRDVLFSSTGAVYGDLCAETARDESCGPLLPVSTYAAGKIGSEAFVSSFCHLYGLHAWIFRFGNVIGARMTHGVIFDFVRRLTANPRELLIKGDGRQEKNYFLVEECIAGMAHAFREVAMTGDAPCDIFNLGTSSITRVVDLAEIVKAEMNLPEARIVIEGTRRAWPGDQPRVHISVDKIERHGWRARLTSNEAVHVAVRRMLGKDDGIVG